MGELNEDQLKEFINSEMTPTDSLNLLLKYISVFSNSEQATQADKVVISKCISIFNEYVSNNKNFTIYVGDNLPPKGDAVKGIMNPVAKEEEKIESKSKPDGDKKTPTARNSTAKKTTTKKTTTKKKSTSTAKKKPETKKPTSKSESKSTAKKSTTKKKTTAKKSTKKTPKSTDKKKTTTKKAESKKTEQESKQQDSPFA